MAIYWQRTNREYVRFRHNFRQNYRAPWEEFQKSERSLGGKSMVFTTHFFLWDWRRRPFETSVRLVAWVFLTLLNAAPSFAESSEPDRAVTGKVTYKALKHKPALPEKPAETPPPSSSAEPPPPPPPKIKFDISIRDRKLGSHSEGSVEGGLTPRQGFEESSIRQVRVKVKTLDDRIKLTATESRSLYAADPSYLLAVAHMGRSSKFVGKERFFFLGNNEGFAGRERLDVTLLQEGQFKASAFTKFTHVDSTFYTPSAFGRDGVVSPYVTGADGFRLRERSGLTSGGELRYGSVSVTTSHGWGWVADRIGAHVEQRVEHSLNWDMRDDPYLRAALPAPLMALMPSSIHSGVFNSSADPELLKPKLRTSTDGVMAGASWEGEILSFNLDYYSYKSKTIGGSAGVFQSKGFGVSADGQLDLGKISLKGGVSYGPGRDSGQDYKAKNSSYNANASITFRPESLPDISVEANIGRYAYKEAGEDYSSKDRSSYRNIVLALDFSKYFQGGGLQAPRLSQPRMNIDLKSIKLFYRFDYFSDAVLLGDRSPARQVIGVTLNARLY